MPSKKKAAVAATKRPVVSRKSPSPKGRSGKRRSASVKPSPDVQASLEKGAQTPAPAPAAAVYAPDDIEDAVEFHDLARAMGTMTRGTWDPDERSAEERKLDFLFAYPPSAPVANIAGRLRKQLDGTFAPGDGDGRLSRFLSNSWDPGSLHELLSRFGLRMKHRPPMKQHAVELAPLRDVAKRRNVRLRVLHGGVDVEPVNMDAAKAEYLDRQEKQQAARDVRAARARMRRELDEAKAGKTVEE